MSRSLVALLLVAITLLAPSARAQSTSPLGLTESIVTPTNSTMARSLFDRVADMINAKDFGARGDTRSAPSACAIIAGQRELTCTEAGWTAADVGKAVVVHGAGTGGAPLLSRIVAVMDAIHATLADAASTTTPAYYAGGGLWVSGTSPVAASGTGYAPGDVLTLSGGAQFTVRTTQVVSATVAADGSGGSNGTCTVTGSTGSFTVPLSALITVAGGAIAAVNAISAKGTYWANPTAPASEPVQGCGLSGARLSLGMGVASVEWTATAAYLSQPVTPMATTGGSGSGATLTPRFWQSGVTLYGSDDWTALAAAYAAASTAGKPLYLPQGSYLLAGQGTASIATGQGACIFGDGPSTRRTETDSGPTLLITSTQAPLFTVSGGVCLRNFAISYPMQDGVASAPVAYPPTVSVAYADESTIEGLRVSATYDFLRLEAGGGSAMGRALIKDNRIYAIRYAFQALSGTADVIQMTNNTFTQGHQENLGTNQAKRDPFGVLLKYYRNNGEAFRIDVGEASHPTVDGLMLDQNFVWGCRTGIHVVSGGITLSRWSGNYWECETQLQVDSAGFVNSTSSVGEGTWASSLAETSTSPAILVNTASGTAASNTDLALVGYTMLHAMGDAIHLEGTGINMVSVTGGKISLWGQSAVASRYYGLSANGTGGTLQLTYTGVQSDPINTIWGHILVHVASYTTVAALITGNSFRNGYYAVLKTGFAGNDVVANNSATALTGPACVYDGAYTTAMMDVSGNLCNVAESNIWHPGQRNAVTGIAAHAHGGQANATLLRAHVNEVTTVAAAKDSVKLPPAIGHGCITVRNAGANALALFGSTSDTVNDGISVTLAVGHTGMWCSVATGRWAGGALQ